MISDSKMKFSNVCGTVLVLGDSISDQGQYVSWLNGWLAITERTDVQFVNAGVSSETCSGLSEPAHPFPRPCVLSRAQRALALVKPDWVLVSYGVNDAIYYPFASTRFEAYQRGIHALLAIIHAAGAKAILATPLVFDAPSFAGTLLPDGADAPGETSRAYSYEQPYAHYDDVLARYAAWVLDDDGGAALADMTADLRTPFLYDIAARRAANAAYHSGDGIHPDVHGHFIVAKALLKTLFGVDTDALEALAGGTLFSLLYARDQILHCYWKEYIGHDNPFKSEVPIDWEKQVAVLNAKIAAYVQDKIDADGFVQHGTWEGFSTETYFAASGYEVIVAKPQSDMPNNTLKNTASKAPWVWRAEFFGAFPAVDLTLLRRGWHVAQLKICDRYGCPKAVTLMEAFRAELVKKYALAPKAVLFGFSRGGLYAANYAARYPENVQCLYLDAPVVSTESWPGGKGIGVGGAPLEYRACLAAYGAGYNDQERIAAVLAAILKAELPLLLVAGDADTVVPYSENGALLADAYEKTNVPCKLLLKHDVGHHPHSVENPEEFGLTAFILAHSKAEK